jgi:Flp pilus assembly pilin Flp
MEPRRTHLLADKRGISTSEYAVLFVLIVVGLVGAWKALNNRMNEHVTSSANRLDAVLSVPAPAPGAARAAVPAESQPEADTPRRPSGAAR